MKDLRPGLFAFLRDDVAIGPLVTTGAQVRIYPVRLQQGIKLASIVYTRVSGQGDYVMTGPSGYSRPRYQIDAWAPTMDAAAALSNVIKDALDGFTGTIGTGANAVFVQGVFVSDEREDYDDLVQLYRVGRDFFIHHGER